MASPAPSARWQALVALVGLTEQDLRVIRLSRRYVQPLLPALCERVGQKLLSAPETRRHFEHDGPADPAVVGRHLRRYLEGLLEVVTTEQLGAWLARVGPAHTPAVGDPRVHVPPEQLFGLLGFLSDEILQAIWATELPVERRLGAIRAFSRLLWVQAAWLGYPPGAAPP